MNTTLGSGKAVHATYEGSVLPKCGGNKSAASYRKTEREVTCKKCLALAPVAEVAAPVAEVAEVDHNGEKRVLVALAVEDKITDLRATRRAAKRGVDREAAEWAMRAANDELDNVLDGMTREELDLLERRRSERA